MVILAIGIGLIMTALGVAIGGLAIELVLLGISRCFSTPAVEAVEQTSAPTVIHLTRVETGINAIDWAEEAAA